MADHNKNNENSNGWGTVNQSITIARPARELYEIWRDLESLPRILTHVKVVRETSPTHSRWVVEGPLGTDVEWDSMLVQDLPARRISWQSTGDSEVDNEGSVEFNEEPGTGYTRVDVHIAYRPPAGSLGKTVAALFGKDPDSQVKDDLENFKEAVETDTFVRSPAGL